MRMENTMRMIAMKNQAVIEEVNDRDLEKLVEENDSDRKENSGRGEIKRSYLAVDFERENETGLVLGGI